MLSSHKCVLIDVGIHDDGITNSNKRILCGDVDKECYDLVSH